MNEIDEVLEIEERNIPAARLGELSHAWLSADEKHVSSTRHGGTHDAAESFDEFFSLFLALR